MNSGVTTAIVLLLASTAACKSDIDMGAVKALVRKAATEVGTVADTVTCPDRADAKIGTKFVCSAGVQGKSYDFDVDIQDGKGKGDQEFYALLTWKRGVAVAGDKLAASFTEEIGADLKVPVKVDCGEPVRFIEDHKISCDLTAGTHKVKAVMTFNDKHESERWQLAPAALSKPKLEELLTESVRAKAEKPEATVTCGDEPLILEPAGHELVCAVETATEHAHLAVALEGTTVKNWKIVP